MLVAEIEVHAFGRRMGACVLQNTAQGADSYFNRGERNPYTRGCARSICVGSLRSLFERSIYPADIDFFAILVPEINTNTEDGTRLASGLLVTQVLADFARMRRERTLIASKRGDMPIVAQLPLLELARSSSMFSLRDPRTGLPYW